MKKEGITVKALWVSSVKGRPCRVLITEFSTAPPVVTRT